VTPTPSDRHATNTQVEPHLPVGSLHQGEPPALVSQHDVVAAQTISELVTPSEGGTRSYQLVGLLHCHACGRRLHSH
jgi:hypothetical protein